MIEMKQGSWKREWDKVEVKSEFWYKVAQSVTPAQRLLHPKGPNRLTMLPYQ